MQARATLKRALAALAITLALILGLAGTAAASTSGSPGGVVVAPNDGPHIYPAGCNSGRTHYNWGNNSYPTYQITVYVSWCWTRGSATTSRVYNVRGSADSASTTIFRDRNAAAPQTASHAAILASDRFGPIADVYGWFQSSNCVTGGLGVICSSWTWHRSHLTLWRGGSLGYHQDS